MRVDRAAAAHAFVQRIDEEVDDAAIVQAHYLPKPMPVGEFAAWCGTVRAGVHHERLAAVAGS